MATQHPSGCPGHGALAALAILGAALAISAPGAADAMRSSVSPLARAATDLGPEPVSALHRIVVALALRDRDGLDAFLRDVHDPASPRFRRALTPETFAARYAPATDDEQALVAYLEQNGFRVTRRFPNRLVVAATGSTGAIERAFGVRLHRVELRGRDHFAALAEPRLPAPLASAVVGVLGLDDLSEMQARSVASGPVPAPRAALGSSCCSLSPNDLAAFYDRGSDPDGTGQTIAIAGAYAWKDSDNTSFASQWGLPGLPADSGQICTSSGKTPPACRFNQQKSVEIALDVEYAHGTAPAAVILNYMSGSTSFTDFAIAYEQIVTENRGHVVSTSWGACESGVSTSTQIANDQIFASGEAVGQSWFAASGDAGSRDCNGALGVDHPANSPHVMGVGGTTPTCSSGMTSGSPACAGYGSESGWSGSGGGVSTLFARPSWQAGCNVPAGSQRLVPDVALEADTSPGNYVLEGGFWYAVGGTSGAAPQWAGIFALLNEASGGAGIGDPGPLLYPRCDRGAFHDVTAGSNGDYDATAGYDLVTGLGTADVAALIALVTVSPVPALRGGLALGLALALALAGAAALRARRPGRTPTP